MPTVLRPLPPELVTLDPWGYPVIAAGPVPADLEEHARRAVASCPTLAHPRLDRERLDRERLDRERRPQAERTRDFSHRRAGWL